MPLLNYLPKLTDYKLFFTYLLSPSLYVLLKTNLKDVANTILLVKENLCYFLITHLKFATNFYSAQLSDIFAYETTRTSELFTANTVVVYNFHNILFHDRFLLFTTNQVSLKSITDLFPNAS